MSGSLFKNDRRGKDTHPNATGTAMIEGVLYEIAAWTKQDKNGNPWQSLAFKRKDEKPAAPAKNAAPAKDDFDDDLPW
jgi:hypothetical protein